MSAVRNGRWRTIPRDGGGGVGKESRRKPPQTAPRREADSDRPEDGLRPKIRDNSSLPTPSLLLISTPAQVSSFLFHHRA